MGTLTVVTSNGQYKKYTYNYSNKNYTDIHVFTTLGKTQQSIAPAISTTKIELSQINPASVSPSKVIAKTNGCMFDYNGNGGFYHEKDY